MLTICFSVSLAAIFMARKDNRSTLFSSIGRNACQFLGIELDGSTRLRIPFSFLPGSCLQTIREVFIEDNIHPARMLQLRCGLRQEHLRCILREGICSTWCQHVDDGCSIKDNDFNSRTASIISWMDQIFQATLQVILFSKSYVAHL